MFSNTRGGDYECRKRVWSSCDCWMWPFSSAGDTHVHKALSLSHTPDTAQAHVTFVCELKSWSYTGAASTHTHKLSGHQSTLHSVLTRVRRGIKEALRAKQKRSTCSLKERKRRRRGSLFPRMIQSPWEEMHTKWHCRQSKGIVCTLDASRLLTWLQWPVRQNKDEYFCYKAVVEAIVTPKERSWSWWHQPSDAVSAHGKHFC